MSSAEASIAGRHVGELGLRHRIVGERAVAELAGGGEGERFVERPPGEAERRRADRDPEQVQRLHRDLEAFAGLAEQLAAHVVEFEPRERVRGDDLDALGDVRPGSSARTMKAEMPREPSPSPVRAKTRQQSAMPPLRDVGFLAVSSQPLPSRRAVMAILAASEPRSGSVIAKAAMASPDGDLGQPFGLLLVIAEQADRARSQALHGEREIGEAVMRGRASRGRWPGCARRARRRRRRKASRKPASPSSRTSARHAASTSSPWASLRWSPRTMSRAARPARDGAARRMASRASQSPWNSGVRLAAKAS